MRFWALGILNCALGISTLAAQQPVPVLPPIVAVKPIDPPRHPLPPEDKSAKETRFSFIIYGDTRSGTGGPTGDGSVINPVHERVVDTMLDTITAQAKTRFPVRFVMQTGDAVLRAAVGQMWNVSYTPTIERLTRGADLPYFLAAGNHDMTNGPAGDPGRELALHNTLTAMSRLVPPEGSPRRLNGYLTYAFACGPVFVIAIDSNVAGDVVQRAWVEDQLQHLDPRRFPVIVAFFHHPPFSSGTHGGPTLETAARVMRESYMPLFRRYHVRILAVGHEHLFEQWAETYQDGGADYRMDEIVTGGGGAPTYTYRGEPNLAAYLAAGAAQRVRLEHIVKPGVTAAENPPHFVVITVDGNQMSEEVVASGHAPYAPFNGQSRIELNDAARFRGDGTKRTP